jgi:hypothetical protein
MKYFNSHDLNDFRSQTDRPKNDIDNKFLLAFGDFLLNDVELHWKVKDKKQADKREVGILVEPIGRITVGQHYMEWVEYHYSHQNRKFDANSSRSHDLVILAQRVEF